MNKGCCCCCHFIRWQVGEKIGNQKQKLNDFCRRTTSSPVLKSATKKNRKSHKAPSVKDVLRNGIFSKQKTDSKCFRKDFCLKQGFSAYHFAAWWLIQPAKVFEFLKNAATCSLHGAGRSHHSCAAAVACGRNVAATCFCCAVCLSVSQPQTLLRQARRSLNCESAIDLPTFQWLPVEQTTTTTNLLTIQAEQLFTGNRERERK